MIIMIGQCNFLLLTIVLFIFFLSEGLCMWSYLLYLTVKWLISCLNNAEKNRFKFKLWFPKVKGLIFTGTPSIFISELSQVLPVCTLPLDFPEWDTEADAHNMVFLLLSSCWCITYLLEMTLKKTQSCGLL